MAEGTVGTNKHGVMRLAVYMYDGGRHENRINPGSLFSVMGLRLLVNTAAKYYHIDTYVVLFTDLPHRNRRGVNIPVVQNPSL
jgi:hypothetical protein